MKTRILINIEGGNVQRVDATDDIEIIYLDHDNMQAGDLSTCKSLYEPNGITTREEMGEIVRKAISKHI